MKYFYFFFSFLLASSAFADPPSAPPGIPQETWNSMRENANIQEADDMRQFIGSDRDPMTGVVRDLGYNMSDVDVGKSHIVYELNPDGTRRIVSILITLNWGTTIQVIREGVDGPMVIETTPDGLQITRYANGAVMMRFPDGSSVYALGDTRLSVDPNGHLQTIRVDDEDGNSITVDFSRLAQQVPALGNIVVRGPVHVRLVAPGFLEITIGTLKIFITPDEIYVFDRRQYIVVSFSLDPRNPDGVSIEEGATCGFGPAPPRGFTPDHPPVIFIGPKGGGVTSSNKETNKGVSK
jgi:hypothetical protein